MRERTLRVSQSPSLRGSGRFRCPADRRPAPHAVSIPFIAGQWSLRPVQAAAIPGSAASQSPSLRGSGRFPPPHGGGARRRIMSQSPSLRGSGRFLIRRIAADAPIVSQSPSLRGSGRFCADVAFFDALEDVSIPFIAGQWSLRGGAAGGVPAPRRRSQSPSLRGSGRFPEAEQARRAAEARSIPFIAGQWSLRENVVAWAAAFYGFQSPSLRGSGRFCWLPSPSRRGW